MKISLVALAEGWLGNKYTDKQVKDWSTKNTVFQPMGIGENPFANEDIIFSDGTNNSWNDVEHELIKSNEMSRTDYKVFYELVNQPTE